MKNIICSHFVLVVVVKMNSGRQNSTVYNFHQHYYFILQWCRCCTYNHRHHQPTASTHLPPQNDPPTVAKYNNKYIRATPFKDNITNGKKCTTSNQDDK